MATFTGCAQISWQSDFQQRVGYALNVAAINAYNEVGTTPGHALRAVFATKVLNGDYNLQAITLAVLTNSTIASEGNSAVQPGNSIPDGDIQFAINSIFSALAGA